MTFDSSTENNRSLPTVSSSGCESIVNRSRAPAIANDTMRRDHALFFNSLLPLMDLASFVFAIYLAKLLHALWYVQAPLVNADERVMLAIALLAPMLLYDKRFVSVASRAQYNALVRCYLTGFLLFLAAVGVITVVGDALRSVPAAEFVLWLGFGFCLTATTRLFFAGAAVYCARKGLLTEVVAIVGDGPRAENLVRYFRNTQPVKAELLGVFDDEPPLTLVGSERADAAALTGNIDDLIALGKTRRIDWIFLALRQGDDEKLALLVHRLKALAAPIALGPPLLESGYGKQVDYIADFLPVTLLNSPRLGWRTTVRSVGQFLPRWIVTLITMTTVLSRPVQSFLTTPRSLRKSQRSELLCELDDHNLDSFMSVVRDYGHLSFGYVVTPNVDHFIRLHDDVSFRAMYDDAEFVLMDSRFLANLLRITSGARLPVVTGSDLTAALLDVLSPSDRIVVIGGRPEQIDALKLRYELENIAHHNPPMGFSHDADAVRECIEFVEQHSPFRYCLLAVGSPQQEFLAQSLRQRDVARGLTFCIGASIDFLTGVEKRAPRWMQRLGVEWAYRLLQNPTRLATRYLVRGPRIFWLLRRTKFALRKRTLEPPAVTERAQAA